MSKEALFSELLQSKPSLSVPSRYSSINSQLLSLHAA
ncbi:unnamed protein product, partial [Vitis vinifera]|uniref:Uncharacterized protein n=1 Tax=Vitis vinifera TaxID=29760 RepID=D7T025_VITVI